MDTDLSSLADMSHDMASQYDASIECFSKIDHVIFMNNQSKCTMTNKLITLFIHI